MTAGAIITAEAVSFAVGGTSLVRDVALALEPGTMTVIVGPNGAGKSTLLRLLTGELAPSAGRVMLEGQPLATLKPWRLACLRAVMSQSVRMAFPFVVRDVVALGADGVGARRPRAAVDAAIDAALEAADVSGLAGRRYQTLSGGEQQRVQFARALCQLDAGRSMAPRQVLFLDEPVASLDLCHQLAVLDAARRVADGGSAVLAVLHDLNLAITYADWLLVLADGAVVAAGPPAGVLDDRLVKRVFQVDLTLGEAPPPPQTFVLPQGHRRDVRMAV